MATTTTTTSANTSSIDVLNDARQLRDLLEKAVKVKQRRDDQMLALETQLARQEANARDTQAKNHQLEQRHADGLQSFLTVVKSLQTAHEDLHADLLQLVDENDRLKRKSNNSEDNATASSSTTSTATAASSTKEGNSEEKPPKLKTRSLTTEFTPVTQLPTSPLKTTSNTSTSALQTPPVAPPPLPDM